MKHAHHHHRERRARLIAEMRARSGGGIAAIPTAPEALRNADTHYPYRPDSHFYYLAGFPEPEAVVILIAGTEAGDSRQILFCRDKNPEREIWDGFRYGPDAAREIFGFDEAHPISELAVKLADETCARARRPSRTPRSSPPDRTPACCTTARTTGRRRPPICC